jgi:hypothetical protein
MIRELTKSALSFAWAFSLLGVKQTVNLGKGAPQNGGDLFAPVTQVAVGQLDDSMKSIFRSGENLQSRMVDAAFSWMSPLGWLKPGEWRNVSNWASPANWVTGDNWNQPAANGSAAAGGCGCSASGTVNPATASASAPMSDYAASTSATGWGPPRT